MKITKFEDIEAWKLARELTQHVYARTKASPFSKDFGLKDQIQRAAGSIMHNIAEGYDSESNAEFVRFLRYAKRSCSEVQSQLYVALDNDYLAREDFESLYELTRRTRAAVRGFISYLVKYSSTDSANRVHEEPAIYDPHYNSEPLNPRLQS